MHFLLFTFSDGYAGDGYRCEQQGCDIMRNCDPNAQCLYDSRNNLHRCVCNQGFKGMPFSIDFSSDNQKMS